MTSFKGNPSHWAFQEGAAAGREGNTVRRGLMSFGLSCAATALDAENTRQWLSGFDSTVGLRSPTAMMPEWRDGNQEPVAGTCKAVARPDNTGRDGIMTETMEERHNREWQAMLARWRANPIR